MKTSFKSQVDLLIDVIKFAIIPDKLALKGGTAINLFLNDMPRLSVDIDLAYLQLNTREQAADDIKKAVADIMINIKQQYPNIACRLQATKEGFPSKIQVIRDRVEIKIEINNVFRGSVYPPVHLPLCDKAQSLFGKYVKIQNLSLEDVYAGKFCAALDRQHPRDLYDVMVFFNRFIFTEKLKNAFLIYLLSAGRPIIELLQPNYLDQEDLYKKELLGMTEENTSYQQLVEAQARLIELINESLSDNDKNFLISFESGSPDWSLFPIQGIENLPSIKWRLHNLKKLSIDKKQLFVQKLIQRWD